MMMMMVMMMITIMMMMMMRLGISHYAKMMPDSYLRQRIVDQYALIIINAIPIG